MFIITRIEPDELMFDVLSEDDGSPIMFASEFEAKIYIEKICEGFGVTPDTFMVADGVENWPMH